MNCSYFAKITTRKQKNGKLINMTQLYLFLESNIWYLLLKGAVAPIVPAANNTYALSNPFPSKPSIVFSAQKPFYSQPNYSSW